MKLENRNKLIFCVFISILTIAVYWQIQNHEFINYDDDIYITENTNISKGFTSEAIRWAFTTPYASNWHPITWLSHSFDYQLYGLEPGGHHRTNLIFHTANAILLFLVFMRMTGAFWQSTLVATLFAIHPLHVESVAWASERKDVLSMFFMMLTIWAYLRYVEKNEIKRYLLVVVFFALGLMSKPMLVTLPFVLLLLDFWPLNRAKVVLKKLFIEKIPLIGLAMVSSVITFFAQQNGGATKSLELYSMQARIFNAIVSYLEYLWKTVWPVNLSILYPHPGDTLQFWKVLLSGLVLTGITVLVVKAIRRAPYLAVGWFWYLGTLIPVIGIVQVGGQAMADRYSYIPLIGIFIILAWGLPELVKNNKSILLAGIIIPILTFLTWQQAGYWENSVTIFNHAIKVSNSNNPNFAAVHTSLGNAHAQKGSFVNAVIHYKNAIKINPGHYRAHNNLGAALHTLGEIDEAIIQYTIVIKINPQNILAHTNLANALAKTGSYSEAVTHYESAIKIKPDFQPAHENLKIVQSIINQK